MRTLFALLLASTFVAAKPPTVEGYVRLDAFRKQLSERIKKLKEEEAFNEKPFPEQLLIKWEAGETSFGKIRKLTGDKVIEEIFKWDELQATEPTKAAKRVMELLPQVMSAKYGQIVKMNKTFKNERYKTTAELVDHLVKPPAHVRQLAIVCLEAAYGTRLRYVANDPKSTRMKRQKAWDSHIKKLKTKK